MTVSTNQVLSTQATVAPENNKSQNPAAPSPFLLAILVLMETLNTQSNTMMVKAKQSAQQLDQGSALNKEAADLHLVSVPMPQYSYKKETKLTAPQLNFEGVPLKQHKYTVEVKGAQNNAGAVLNANVTNQQISQLRMELNQRVGTIQQGGSITMNGLNVDAQNLSQVYQETSGLLSTWRTVTFSADLTQPTQNQ